MTMHPNIQCHAQAELDSVTGGLRLPTYEDKPNLPYVNAILREILRSNPVAPGGWCLSQHVMRVVSATTYIHLPNRFSSRESHG